MNWLDKAILAVDPQRAQKRAVARMMTARIQQVSAGYDGAGKGPRWFSGASTSQNTENRQGLARMRNASRELERNNPYVGIAVNAIDTYTVGMGITPKAKHPEKTKKARKKTALADALMRDWMLNPEIDFDGQCDLFGLQGLATRTVALSGESLALCRFETDRRLAVPLRLQMLEGDFLDETKDTGIAGGAGDFQGVQFSNNRRSGYWLYGSHPGERNASVLKSEIVKADRVAHMYEVLRPGQVRGMPKGYNVFTRMKGLDDFNDAFIELQRMAACFGFAVYSEEGDGRENPVIPDRVHPGFAAQLAGNDRIAFSTPPTVSGQEPFAKNQERLIASAYEITYSALTGDYSEGNFAAEKMAAIRMHLAASRRRRRMLQPMLLKKIERWWLEAAAMKGYDLTGISFSWSPPRKEILDLKNELPAIIQKIRAGMGSLQGELREWGMDIETVMEEVAEDAALCESLGIVVDSNVSQTNKNGQLQTLPQLDAVNDTTGEDDA